MASLNSKDLIKNILFDAKSKDENEYNISISSKDGKLFIVATNKRKIPNKKYENNFTLKDLQELCKYFLMFSNLSDLFEEIKQIVIKNSIIVNEKENNIELILSLPSPTIKEVIFSLNEKEKNISEQINELYSLIQTDIEGRTKNLLPISEKIKLLKEKTKKLEEDKIICDNYMKKLEEENKSLKDKIEKIENEFYIDKKNEKLKLIKNWIYEDKRKNIMFHLLFKMTRDGDSTKSFHNNCDYKGPTVTIIETDDNYIFGGFTNGSWDSEGHWANHGKDFVFSINRKKKYSKGENGNGIECGPTYGPNFSSRGDSGIWFKDDTLKQGIYKSDIYNTNGELYIKSNFKVKEIEIYQVNFSN